ncbi:glycosyltransferase family 4 protein [Halogeometricum borinquense]|uniref:Glycosyltransferase family 4 protein n=1 Tax=Halogeometricum borinquense TaxID=60847 RepID=A0A6C0UE54_9EURY|nr:glycosyltransferase family 4 protein [Halogeometricum borinquense]QIB73437.1 glycosyltransferase family 4 protein [Halogeometricum borinquense]QIQ77161.1 glycosyltransferase family 4 protein [Halogeometricum borinquense]
MRIAFVSMYTEQLRADGATRRMRRVSERLAASGHDVSVLCAQWWEGEVPEFEQNDVNYIRVTETPSAPKFASKVPFALRRVKPDVIHATNSPPTQVTGAKTAARFLRVPVVVDWWAEREGDSSSACKRAARGPKRVIAPSQMVKTDVREYGAPEEAVRVVPESIDFDLVREAEADDRADILYSRHLDQYANVESFFLALAELRDKDWRAAVIGDGPERAEAEQTAADLRIDDRVEFLGELPPEEFVPIMKGAHVFAQTAAVEPFANDLLWALASGCVGIVEYQARSSAHELVVNCDRGARVTSPQELADEISAAAGYSQESINEEFASFDHDDVLRRYEDIYADAIEDYGWF